MNVRMYLFQHGYVESVNKKVGCSLWVARIEFNLIQSSSKAYLMRD